MINAVLYKVNMLLKEKILVFNQSDYDNNTWNM